MCASINPKLNTAAYRMPPGGFSPAANGQGRASDIPVASPAIRFGAIDPSTIKLPVLIRPVDFAFSRVLNTRTKEMLLEDLVGFGLLRTGIDLYRQRIMGQGTTDEHGHQELNIPAARERLLREICSILTDNVSGGVFAFGVAMLANRVGQRNLSQNFVSDQSLGLFKNIVSQMPPQSRQDKAAFEKAFIKGLSSELSLSEKDLASAYKNWASQNGQEGFNKQLADMIRNADSKREGFTLKAKSGGSFQASELLEDSRHFMNRLPEGAKGEGLQEAAGKLLKQSAKMNKLQYLGIGGALGLTFGVPFAIQSLTRKLDGFSNYPGDKGIRRMVSVNEEEKKGWIAQHFPYMSEMAKQKNPAILLPLLPLVFAMGLFDTRALSRLAAKEAFNAPWKKEFIPRLKEMYQFGKGFPFTTQQQMASCFAFLIFSRMVTARSDIEYRERSVDSLLGWSTWILGTPLLKRIFSKSLEKRMEGVHLFNQNGALKTYDEIKHFQLPNQTAKSLGRTMASHRLISAASLLFSIATLGMLEPIIAIKWTAHRAKKHETETTAPQNPFYPVVAAK